MLMTKVSQLKIGYFAKAGNSYVTVSNHFHIIFPVDTCPPLTRLQNVTLNTTVTIYDTYVQMTCHEGHTFSPGHWVKVVKCMELGVWNESAIMDCVGKSNNLFQDWTEINYFNLYSRVHLE